MRKKLFWVLISVFIIQLLVPAAMIAYSVSKQAEVETNGKEYYISADPYLVSDSGEIMVSVLGCSYASVKDEDKARGYVYAVLTQNSQGYAYVESASFEKPTTPYYIRSESPSTFWNFPDINYTPSDKATQDAMRDYVENHRYYGWLNNNEDTFTIRIKVYNGKYIVKGMQINGIEIEEYFKN